MESSINEFLDEFIKKGSHHQPIDFVDELATPITTDVIHQALGVPQKDVERLSYDSEVCNNTSRNAAKSAIAYLHKYIAELVQSEIDCPGDDFISTLVKQYHQGHITERDIIILALLILAAENAASICSIGVGVLTLLQHPQQLEEFKKRPTWFSSLPIASTSAFRPILHSTHALPSSFSYQAPIGYSSTCINTPLGLPIIDQDVAFRPMHQPSTTNAYDSASDFDVERRPVSQ